MRSSVLKNQTSLFAIPYPKKIWELEDSNKIILPEELEKLLQILNIKPFLFPKAGCLHYRLGAFDFWAASDRWYCEANGRKGIGVSELVIAMKKFYRLDS